MSQLPVQAVSELLVRRRAGDQQGLQALIPLVYKELHAVAHRYLQNERVGHTLLTTALVHEAYLRLADKHPFGTQNRAHFVAVAARLMRQILVDYARSHRAAKRGADLDEGLTKPAPRFALLRSTSRARWAPTIAILAAPGSLGIWMSNLNRPSAAPQKMPTRNCRTRSARRPLELSTNPYDE